MSTRELKYRKAFIDGNVLYIFERTLKSLKENKISIDDFVKQLKLELLLYNMSPDRDDRAMVTKIKSLSEFFSFDQIRDMLNAVKVQIAGNNISVVEQRREIIRALLRNIKEEQKKQIECEIKEKAERKKERKNKKQKEQKEKKDEEKAINIDEKIKNDMQWIEEQLGKEDYKIILTDMTIEACKVWLLHNIGRDKIVQRIKVLHGRVMQLNVKMQNSLLTLDDCLKTYIHEPGAVLAHRLADGRAVTVKRES